MPISAIDLGLHPPTTPRVLPDAAGRTRKFMNPASLFMRLGYGELGRAQEASATHPEGIMLHGEVLQAVVFSRTGFASDAVGVALESVGYSRRTRSTFRNAGMGTVIEYANRTGKP